MPPAPGPPLRAGAARRLSYSGACPARARTVDRTVRAQCTQRASSTATPSAPRAPAHSAAKPKTLPTNRHRHGYHQSTTSSSSRRQSRGRHIRARECCLSLRDVAPGRTMRRSRAARATRAMTNGRRRRFHCRGICVHQRCPAGCPPVTWL